MIGSCGPNGGIAIGENHSAAEEAGLVRGGKHFPRERMTQGTPMSGQDFRRSAKLTSLAIVFGCVVAWAVYRRAMPVTDSDFSIVWYGARALVSGLDPYSVVGPGKAYPWGFPLIYPAPALVVGAPFTLLSARLGIAAFAGVGAATLWVGVVRSGQPHRLLLLVSAPFVYAIGISQWSPLLTAAALMPAVGFVFAAKPTIGAALFLYRPTWRAALGAVALIALAFVLDPGWPGAWQQAMRGNGTHLVVPILNGVGPVVALAALRWRRPEARLLLVMACVPQTPVLYEMLPLGLIPSTLPEMLAYVALSWIGYAWWYVSGVSVHAGVQGTMHLSLVQLTPLALHIALLLFYIPCLIMVLWRQPEGSTWSTVLNRSAARAAAAIKSRRTSAE